MVAKSMSSAKRRGERAPPSRSKRQPTGSSAMHASPKPAAPAAEAVAANGHGGDLPGPGNIDKIRDIIFGNQMRDYEKRFVRLEERVLKESADLRDEVRRRFDQLEGHVGREFEAFGERLARENAERSAADEGGARELRELHKAADKRFGQVEEQAARGARELRQQLLDLGKQLSDDMRQRGEALGAALDRQGAELRAEKTDRAALAALFTEMALRLSDQLALPEG